MFFYHPLYMYTLVYIYTTKNKLQHTAKLVLTIRASLCVEMRVRALSMHTFLQAGVIQAMLVTKINVQETTITGLPHKAH